MTEVVTTSMLLEHFDRIAEAPDAVARLRRFVLELAVRGRLVEQRAEEGRTSDAFRSDPRWSAPANAPFELPASWAWAQVRDIAESRLGKMLDKAKNRGSPRRYLRNVNVRWFDFDLSDVLEMRLEDHELSELALQSGDILVCEGGEPGRAAVWDEREPDIYFQKALHRVRPRPGFSPAYFVLSMREAADSGRLATSFTGVTIKHLTGKGLACFAIPVPPPAEQTRIVAKVDDLMALCDELEAAQTKREKRRDRLVTASLHALTNGEGADEPASTQAREQSVRFYLNHLPRLTTRPEHIQQLRETILDLAVRGRLVPQDPAERLAANPSPFQSEPKSPSRARLARSDEPFEIPETWAWTRLGEVGEWGSGSTPPRSNPDLYGGGTTWLKSGELDDDEALRGSEETVTEVALSACHFRRNKAGDVLIAMYGATIGKLAIIAEPAVTNQAVCACTPRSDVFNRYLFAYLRAQRTDLRASSEGGAQPNISKAKIVQFPIPLPPLPEQRRIVAKVDELMALCEALELSIAASQTGRAPVLEAALHSALSDTSFPT